MKEEVFAMSSFSEIEVVDVSVKNVKW